MNGAALLLLLCRIVADAGRRAAVVMTVSGLVVWTVADAGRCRRRGGFSPLGKDDAASAAAAASYRWIRLSSFEQRSLFARSSLVHLQTRANRHPPPPISNRRTTRVSF